MTSAYPITVGELTRRVEALAIELSEIPSRNRVMTEFKVGAKKATAALDALTADGFDPTAPDPAPVRQLHSVPPTTKPERESEPSVQQAPETTAAAELAEGSAVVQPVVDPGPRSVRERVALVLLALPAFASIWGGWVGLGRLTGFGPIQLLPGIVDGFEFNSAITLPIGVETYAAFALRVWLSGSTRSARTRSFAKWSAIGSLLLGMAGQVAYHLMTAAGMTQAPWQITTLVSCLPVVVLGCGAALAQLLHSDEREEAR
jgi:hypothetical protein